MISSYDVIAAFAVGFMGSLHCIGMCGGISSALTAALAPNQTQRAGRLFGYQLLYSAGRITSYSTAGALVGFIGGGIYTQLSPDGPSYLRIFAGVMMVLLGAYIAGWWRVLAQLERLGQRLWSRISPLTKRLIPVSHPLQAYALGMLWGWLPCGLVYSALAWSLGAGDAASGALLMLYFGLGTLPALLSIGLASHVLNDIARAKNIRLLAGLLLIAYGLWTLGTQLGGGGHHH